MPANSASAPGALQTGEAEDLAAPYLDGDLVQLPADCDLSARKIAGADESGRRCRGG